MSALEMVRFMPWGPQISRPGMGCWAIGGHGWGEVKESESIAAIRFAFDQGINFFDTADVYGLGKSEEILRLALGAHLKFVFFASKGGVRWDETGKVWNDSSPSYIRQALESSLRRLNIEKIPLYYIHKPDNKTPIAEIIETLAKLKEDGKIGHIGVSNFSVSQLETALAVAPISAIQVRFNLLQRECGEEISQICRKNNIKLVAWGALADGLLTGKFKKGDAFDQNDHRSRSPDFQGERFLKNLEIIEKLKSIAQSRNVSMSQLALRWVMDKHHFACPLFGAKTASQVKENIGVAGWQLTSEEMSAIDRLCFAGSHQGKVAGA